MDAQTTTSDVQAVLAELKFPASKGEVISEAQKQGAAGEVVSLLENLPPQTFNSMEDLIGKLPLGM